jgi:hypothetical protein
MTATGTNKRNFFPVPAAKSEIAIQVLGVTNGKI